MRSFVDQLCSEVVSFFLTLEGFMRWYSEMGIFECCRLPLVKKLSENNLITMALLESGELCDDAFSCLSYKMNVLLANFRCIKKSILIRTKRCQKSIAYSYFFFCAICVKKLPVRYKIINDANEIKFLA